MRGRLPKRQHRTAVNTTALAQNITDTALINCHRPDIAAYLGLHSGGNVRREEEREAQKIRAEALRMQTEALRAKNEGLHKSANTVITCAVAARLPELLIMLSRLHPVFGDWC